MLLTRLPLPLRGVRLACVKPAASVRSEPGSNSQVVAQDFKSRPITYQRTKAIPRRTTRLHSTSPEPRRPKARKPRDDSGPITCPSVQTLSPRSTRHASPKANTPAEPQERQNTPPTLLFLPIQMSNSEEDPKIPPRSKLPSGSRNPMRSRSPTRPKPRNDPPCPRKTNPPTPKAPVNPTGPLPQANSDQNAEQTYATQTSSEAVDKADIDAPPGTRQARCSGLVTPSAVHPPGTRRGTREAERLVALVIG